MLRIVRNRQSLVSTTEFPAGERGDDEAWFRAVPGRSDARRTELAEPLLACQGKFAEDVLRATTAPLAGKGRHRRQKIGGETAGLTFPAGRARHLR